jgi:hypothetical protein
VAIAVSDTHTVALRADGAVRAWGANWYGQAEVPADLVRFRTGPAAGREGTWIGAIGMRRFRSGVQLAAGLVRLDDGEEVSCVLKGRNTALACGDRVVVARTEGGGVIEALLPRATLLYRSDAFKEKLIAASSRETVRSRSRTGTCAIARPARPATTRPASAISTASFATARPAAAATAACASSCRRPARRTTPATRRTTPA